MQSFRVSVPCASSYLRLFPPANDDTNIILGMHNTHTQPLYQERGPFRRLWIRFDRILH